MKLIEIAYRRRDFGPVTLTFSPGQLVMLCGPSGSGKSTLCGLLTGHLEPSSGSLEISAGGVASVGSDVEGQLLGATVRQELALGSGARVAHSGSLFTSLDRRFDEQWDCDPQDLSAGQQQLLLLASLAGGAFQTLVLDEGLSHLDDAAFREACETLGELARGGRTVVVVSHDLRLLRWVDRVVGLSAGTILFDRPVPELVWNDLRSARLWLGTLEAADWPAVARVLPAEGRFATWPDRLGSGISSDDDQFGPSFGGQTFPLPPGHPIAVSGVSGAGKSRWLATLAGLDQLEGWEVDSPGYVAMLPQKASSILWRRSVRAEFDASLRQGQRTQGEMLPPEVPPNWLDRSPRSLSQGQAKYVACWCLLLQAPDLLLLDDPFAGLDSELRQGLETGLRAYLGQGGRLAFSSHHPDELEIYPDTLLILERARPVWHGDSRRYFDGEPDPRLGRPFRQSWMQVRPDSDERGGGPP